MIKLIISSALLFLTSFYAFALDPQFVSINKTFGISIRETNNICKDSNGFIWTASKSGVLRVTEDDCRIYNLPYKTADVLNVKLLLKNDSLYAYTNNGQIFIYNPITDKFEFIINLPKVLNQNFLVVQNINIDTKGYMWMATSYGIYRYKNGMFKHIQNNGVQNLNIQFYDDNNIFYSNKNGIHLLNTSTLKFSPIGKSFDAVFLKTAHYYFDKNEKILWIGTQSSGLYNYSLVNGILRKVGGSYFPNQPILAISPNSDSTLLIGIDGQGIWEISKKHNKLYNIYKENADNHQSLHGNGVYDIFCDDNNRVWISTYSGGLSFFDQKTTNVTHITHRINISNSLSDNNINKIIEDKRGQIWFATNNGLNCWNPVKNTWKAYYKNKNEQAKVFLALKEDAKGNIWAGTYSSGVYVLDGASGMEKMRFGSEETGKRFSVNYIFDFYNDNRGNIWLGGINSDLIRYNVITNEFKKYTGQPTKSIVERAPGKFLLACTYGILALNENDGHTEILAQGFIAQDLNVTGNNVWAATSGDGLIKLDLTTKKISKFTIENGLPSNYINSIIASGKHFWLGTENGLCRFDPSTSKVDLYPSINTFTGTSFNLGSKCRLKNGQLIFGSSNGAVIFDPLKLTNPKNNNKLFLQDIKVSGRSIREIPQLKLSKPLNEMKSVKLDYDQNTLDVELISTGISSGGLKLSWKLNGLDKEWTSPNSRRTITYTNLPSGNFSLHIKMYDSSLSRVLDERIIYIEVVPPIWATWWFRLLIFSTIIGFAIWVLKFYTNKLKQQHSEDKIRFFTSTAHDLRTSLTLIQAPLQQLMNEPQLSEKGKYYLNLATEQSGRLSFVSTQLLDFQKVDIGKGQLFLVMADIVQLVKRRKTMFETACMKKNIRLVFSCNKDSYLSAVDELKIEKVVDNLISNAIKYSYSNSEIKLTLHCDDHNWSLEVKDSGIGISEIAQKKLFKEFYRGDNNVNSKIVGSGIGLLLVKNYVEMHGGKVILSSAENQGAVFTISIPYAKVDNHVAEDQPIDEAFSEFTFLDQEVKPNSHEKEPGIEKKNHILIVEDNNDLQTFLKTSLEPYFKISVAGDGVLAWDIIQKKMPDFVISDIMMPNMDGFALCKLIKSTFDTAHIPVILLTALSDRTEKLEGLNLGADDYITKPFDIALLLQRIKTILRNRIIVREKSLRLIKQTDITEPIMTNELSDKFIKKAYKIVTDNMANCDFGKDEFASAMNASPSLLYKKIKAITNQSPVDFIKTIRLDYSLELLNSKKHSVTEVSEMCGFSSVGYFSTVFKKHFGKSPTEI